MAASWSIPCSLAYGGEIPKPVDSEIWRLRKLLGEHCHGPYDEKGIKIGIGVSVDGRNQFRPIKRSGVRLEPFKNNALYAGIYLREADWDVPLELFRLFLWRNVEKALWTCFDRLNRDQIQLDEPKLKRQLSLVESEFLGDVASRASETSLSEIEPTPLDEYGDDEDNRVIVQYRIDGHGRGSDHDKRVAVENLLGEFLEESDLGYCDGGDIGSGTMNIFCFVKPGQSVGEKITDVLRKNDLLEGAVIVETIKDEERVIWPRDFVGEFDIM